MDYSAFILSRLQFAFTISFHIIFPAFTIGLAAWLAFLGYRIMPILFSGLAAFLVVAGIWVFAAHMRIADEWFQRPFLFVFLVIGGIAGALLVLGLWKKIDKLPPITMVMFAAAYLTMVLAVLPYMVPFSLTFDQVAAPHALLAFLFWFAGIVILPITLAYTIVVYWLFRGRVQTSSDDTHADWHDDEESHDAREAYIQEFEQNISHPSVGITRRMPRIMSTRGTPPRRGTMPKPTRSCFRRSTRSRRASSVRATRSAAPWRSSRFGCGLQAWRAPRGSRSPLPAASCGDAQGANLRHLS